MGFDVLPKSWFLPGKANRWQIRIVNERYYGIITPFLIGAIAYDL